jgi:hypothetical protein
MITALFPAAERQALLDMAARSIVFLTRKETHRLLRQIDYVETTTNYSISSRKRLPPAMGGGESWRVVHHESELGVAQIRSRLPEGRPESDAKVGFQPSHS